MSADTASKRKAPTKDARPSKKAKPSEKTKEKAVNTKLQAAADAKKSRKRAADFVEGESAPAVKPSEDSPKVKKVKISDKVEVEEPVPKTLSKAKSRGEKAGSKQKKNKAEESKALVLAEQDDEIALPPSDDEEDVAALLAGFSSDESDDGDAEEGVALDKLPEAKLDKKSKKALEKANQKNADEDTPGTLYVGRIPHGFYEPQMRAYFTQFGTITNLRLARNKKTGASKHYAFIQFSSAEVADIVARTMNNYLMFGHILKVRLMPEEQVHAELWKGANKRFKVVPRAMIERKEMEKAKGREYWKDKVQKENAKREKKRKAMEELGYEFNAPTLKSVDDVPMKDTAETTEAELVARPVHDEDSSPQPKAIAEGPADVDDVQIEIEKVLKKTKTAEKEKVKVRASKKAKA